MLSLFRSVFQRPDASLQQPQADGDSSDDSGRGPDTAGGNAALASSVQALESRLDQTNSALQALSDSLNRHTDATDTASAAAPASPPPAPAAESNSPASSESDEEQTAKDIAHSDEIAKNARANWIGLLVIYAFTTIVWMRVEDIDFFVPSKATQLPLINISIPTLYFFTFAPALIAILFVYFQLYLLKHWQVLSRLPARVQGQPVAERLYPWLITDYALALRKAEPGQESVAAKPLDILRNFAVIFLVWLAGPLVVGLLWWRSMPRHDEWLTSGIGLCLILTLIAAVHGYLEVKRKVGRRPERHILAGCGWSGFILACVFLLFVGGMRTEWGKVYRPSPETLRSGPAGEIENEEDKEVLWWKNRKINSRISASLFEELFSLSPLDFSGNEFVTRKHDWLFYDLAKEKGLFSYCHSIDNICKEDIPVKPEHWEAHWKSLRKEQMLRIAQIDLTDSDLRGADFANTFLPGVKFQHSRLDGSVFSKSYMEWADFSRASLRGVKFEQSKIQHAIFTDSFLSESLIINSDMQNSSFRGIKTEKLGFNETNLKGSDMSHSQFIDSAFHNTSLEDTDLSHSKFNNLCLTYEYPKDTITSADFSKTYVEDFLFFYSPYRRNDSSKFDLLPHSKYLMSHIDWKEPTLLLTSAETIDSRTRLIYLCWVLLFERKSDLSLPEYTRWNSFLVPYPRGDAQIDEIQWEHFPPFPTPKPDFVPDTPPAP